MDYNCYMLGSLGNSSTASRSSETGQTVLCLLLFLLFPFASDNAPHYGIEQDQKHLHTGA